MWKPTISSDEIYHTAIAHSAKGSTWKDHKYIKKIGDAYIYAKAAGKAKKNAKKYEKDFDKQMKENGLGDKEVEQYVIDRNEGHRGPTEKGKEKYYGKNSAYYTLPGDFGKAYRNHQDNIQKAAETKYQQQRQERISSKYDTLAKKKMESLRDEIGSDVKKTISKLKPKKKTSKTKEYITDNKTGKKRSVDRSGKTINIKELSEKNKKKK